MSPLALPLDLDLPGEGHPYYVLDVFTDAPLEGNQLGVFTDGRPFSTEQMQSIARELNVSETIFVLPPERGGDVRVRIFTPGAELPFAGHPLLGGAFVVGTALGLDEVKLETVNAVVPLRLERSGGEVVFGWMTQPPQSPQLYDRTEELLAAIGVEASLLPVEVYENGPRHVLVRLADEAAVAALRPDLAALAGHERVGINCFAGEDTQWKLRMFGPAIGIAEDPATGSAAGPLAVHLGRHAVVPFGTTIEIREGVEINRPSTLYARAAGADEGPEVGGSAVVVARGRYRVT
jgi:trans-2,3-dihydro-3-hydroxyanthranilate isomerase